MTSTNMNTEFDKSKVYLHDTGFKQWVCIIKSIKESFVYYESNVCIEPTSSGTLYSGGHNSLGKGVRLATEDEISKANSLLKRTGESFRFPSNNLNTIPNYDIY